MIEILFENEELVFVIKPANCSSEEEMTLLLSQQLNSPIFAVHRLDTIVSGVMLYAKTKDCAAFLSEKIARGEDFEKNYLAVCLGTFEEKKGIMEDLLFKDSSKQKAFVVKKERRGVKRALLCYEVLDETEYKNQKISLLKICLKTGRFHQIRVQLASRKHPILGDGKYGSRFNCPIALFSQSLATDDRIIYAVPPKNFPWSLFDL